MFEGSTIQYVVQGGAVGVSLCTLYVIFDMSRRFTKTIDNHMDHDFQAKKDDVESRAKNAEVLQKLVDVVQNLGDLIKKQ